MKRKAFLSMLISLCLLSACFLTACGSSESSAAPIDNSDQKTEETKEATPKTSSEMELDGVWSDGTSRTLTIEGEKGLLTWYSDDYLLTIDKSNNTITAKAYSYDGSDVVFDYDFIGGKLVLTTDNEQAIGDRTTSYEREE